MIDYIQVTPRKRKYMYTGKDRGYTGRYLGLTPLSKRSECVVSRPTLCQRLTCGINKSEIYHWRNVMQCMTEQTIVGRPLSQRGKEFVKRTVDIEEDFINLMLLMPAGSLYRQYKRMQSTPIKKG